MGISNLSSLTIIYLAQTTYRLAYLLNSEATGGTSEPAAYTHVGTAKGQVQYAVVEDVDCCNTLMS
jgi:hypothetical protein